MPRRPSGAVVVANQVYATAQEEIRPLLPSGMPDPYRPLQYGLDQLGIDAARAVSNGAGVRVAILDSAPASGHADLGPIEILALEGGPSAQPGAHGTLALLLGAGATPAEARAALFRQAADASEGSDAVLMPPLCDVLARLGKRCAQP